MLYCFDLDETLIKGYLATKDCEDCGGDGFFAAEVGPSRATGPCERCKGKGQIFDHSVKIDYDIVEALPGRSGKLFKLANEGARFAICTNQGGVAMGYQRAIQVYEKTARAVAWFECFYGRPLSIHHAMAHPDSKEPYWRRPDQLRLRKPNPGMIEDAMAAHFGGDEAWADPRAATVYVGDMASDKQAAEAAGVRFEWAKDFFDD